MGVRRIIHAPFPWESKPTKSGANDRYAQAVRCRRRHQPRRPPLAKIRPGRPAPAIGPGTLEKFLVNATPHARASAALSFDFIAVNPYVRIPTAAGISVPRRFDPSIAFFWTTAHGWPLDGTPLIKPPGRSGHIKSQRSCRLISSRLGQSPFSCSFHFIMFALRPYFSMSLETL